MHKDAIRDYKSVVKLLEYLRSRIRPSPSKCLLMILPFVDRTMELLLWNIGRLPGWEEDFKQFVYCYFLESVFGKRNINSDFSAARAYHYVIRTVGGLLKNFFESMNRPERRLDEDIVKGWVDKKSQWHNFVFELDQKVVEQQINEKICDYVCVRRKADKEVVKRMIGMKRWKEYTEVG